MLLLEVDDVPDALSPPIVDGGVLVDAVAVSEWLLVRAEPGAATDGVSGICAMRMGSVDQLSVWPSPSDGAAAAAADEPDAGAGGWAGIMTVVGGPVSTNICEEPAPALSADGGVTAMLVRPFW